MANIELKIVVNESASGDRIDKIITQSPLSNVSIKQEDISSGLSPLPTQETAIGGREMLSFDDNGLLRFTQSGFLSNNGVSVGKLASEQNPDEFVWGVVPSNKQFGVEIRLYGENINKIVVVGDKEANQFPTQAVIDNSEIIYNNDNVWDIEFTNESSSHTIQFTEWNRANYNACLTLIRVMLQYYSLADQEIQSVETLSQTTARPREIYYGVTPSSGSAQINDIQSRLYDMLNDGIIKYNNLPIEIWANGKKVDAQISTESDYDDYSKTFTAQLQNELSFWDSLQFNGNALFADLQGVPQQTTLITLLYIAMQSTGYTTSQINQMLDNKIVFSYESISGAKFTTVGTVLEYLQSIKIYADYLEKCSVREIVEQICTIAQLIVTKNDNGEIKFVTARPIRTGLEPIIFIPIKNQYSIPQKDIILKNKYSGVNLTAKKVDTQIEFNSVAYNTKIGIIDYNFEEIDHTGKRINNLIGGGAMTSSCAYSQIKTQYIYGSFTIPKQTNNNLETILDILSSAIDWQITYREEKGTASAVYKGGATTSQVGDKDYTIGQVVYGTTSFTDSSGKITRFSANAQMIVGNIAHNAVVQLDDNTYFDIETLSNGGWFVDYTICVGSEILTMNANNVTLQSTQQNADCPISGKYVRYIPSQIEITINGNKRVIYFEDLNVLVGSNENVFAIEGSNLTQSYGEKNNYSILIENILNDYADGIETAKVTVSCSDYFDTNGIKRKSWQFGDILKVGDIVCIGKDNIGNSAYLYANGQPKVWKITSRNFRYDGIPLLDLELQESKTITN